MLRVPAFMMFVDKNDSCMPSAWFESVSMQQLLQIHQINHVVRLLIGQAIGGKSVDDGGPHCAQVNHRPIAIPIIFPKAVPHDFHFVILALHPRYLNNVLCIIAVSEISSMKLERAIG